MEGSKAEKVMAIAKKLADAIEYEDFGWPAGGEAAFNSALDVLNDVVDAAIELIEETDGE